MHMRGKASGCVLRTHITPSLSLSLSLSPSGAAESGPPRPGRPAGLLRPQSRPEAMTLRRSQQRMARG